MGEAGGHEIDGVEEASAARIEEESSSADVVSGDCAAGLGFGEAEFGSSATLGVDLFYSNA